ncbi:MAG: serine/threonine-protein kinase [Betaproteobacteria bacterium]
MPLDQLGRYEIIEELGRGAMGVVYKARDPLIDRIVALKTVGLGLSCEESEAFEQRFYREAKSAGRLNHSNIVTIHDVGKSDDVAYIAMEFLQGLSLREILDSGVVLPPEKIAEIVTQVADGLAFAHEHGVVHRDIKPPNIMVLDNGSVKITDFGIALLPTGSRTLAGTIFGSPKYMSPEQVIGRPVDGRADIFSLGAVLYELLTGFPPFFGGDLDAVFYQVINEMPAAPTTRISSIAPAFDYIVAKAMAKNPDDRYASAKAMALDLRHFRDLQLAGVVPHEPRMLERRATRRDSGEPAEALRSATSGVPPEGASSRTVAADITAFWQRRKLVMYGLSAALVVVIVGGAVLSMRATNPVPPAADQVADTGTAEKLAATKPGATGLPSREGEPVDRAAPSLPAALESAPAVAKPTPAVVQPMARLALAVTPWGEVYVDGKKAGISPPLTELRLAPGKHAIEVRNTTFEPYVQSVNLDAAAYVKIKHKFQ